MKRYILVILLFNALGCKKEIKPVFPNEMIIHNKAYHCFGGLKKNKINPKEYGLLKEYLVNLKNPLSRPGLNLKKNYGFLEAEKKQNDTELIVLFTDLHGDLIKYNGKFYRNDKIVNLIKKTVKISEKFFKKTDCQ